ncbi:MAG: EamA family transporter [Solirubrobacterales bacterium]|nr:EamA family transporter [Solirubrobacterales bacterium]
MPSAGALFCLSSAAAFGAMGIFGKLAYEEGATVGTLLAVRFVLAAALFWLFLVGSRGTRDLRALPRRDVGIALALGAVAYSAQAGGYFAALDASTPRWSRCSSTRSPRSSP